jgi:hypothetical protein
MELQLRALLLASLGLPAARISWGEHPQSITSPYVVLTRISDGQGLTLKGPDMLTRSRVQIDIYAPVYSAAKQVSDAVKALLHGYRGAGFRLVSHDGTRDSREGGEDADRLHRISMDFLVTWRET